MTIDDEVRRAARLLEALIQAAGVSHDDLERRLEASPGYVGRLLSGEVELKLRHVLAISRALEIEPALFFQTLYPAAEPAGGTVQVEELHQRLKALGFATESAPARPEVRMEDLERLLQEAVQSVLSRQAPEDQD
jgi:transcriptional regulator with XRE-family HTH domain